MHAVPRATHSLEERRDRTRRADLHHEVDIPDVDTELERRRGDEDLELARLEPLLGVETPSRRKAAVMARDVFRSETRAEPRGDALGHLARIHEHERRAVITHERGHALVDLFPHFVRADRGEG